MDGGGAIDPVAAAIAASAASALLLKKKKRKRNQNTHPELVSYVFASDVIEGEPMLLRMRIDTEGRAVRVLPPTEIEPGTIPRPQQ